MWMRRGKGIGWLCIPPFVLKWIALGMIAAGILIILIFVPAQYWMALIGILLIAGGIAIRFIL